MAKRYDKKTAYHYGMYLAMQGRFDEYSFSKDADGYIIEKENEDASQRLAFGLCKKYGIDLPKGATPGDAWAALKEKTGKTVSDFYNQSGSSGADKIKFGTASPKTFSKALLNAKKKQKPQDEWRVTGLTKAEVLSEHPKAKLHVTDGGSTIAIDNGDIVALCKNPGDQVRGSELVNFAIKNGGNKCDSYEGNHGLYCKLGFEPVSWCQWDPEYAPPTWDANRDKPENIIFYKYTGKKVEGAKAEDFFRKVPAATDYFEAQQKRDRSM